MKAGARACALGGCILHKLHDWLSFRSATRHTCSPKPFTLTSALLRKPQYHADCLNRPVHTALKEHARSSCTLSTNLACCFHHHAHAGRTAHMRTHCSRRSGRRWLWVVPSGQPFPCLPSSCSFSSPSCLASMCLASCWQVRKRANNCESACGACCLHTAIQLDHSRPMCQTQQVLSLELQFTHRLLFFSRLPTAHP